MNTTRSFRQRVRGGFPEGVAYLCLVIFIADVVAGIIIPTFPIYARSLGISLALLGVLTTVGAITQFAVSIPLGIASDRYGRTIVILGGLLAFTGTMLAFAAANGAVLITLGRILQGIAIVASFQIGAALLGDITESGKRAVAFGWYTTAMGFGFTVGPLIGGWIADRWDARVSYVVAAAIALLGAVVAKRTLDEPPLRRAVRSQRSWFAHVGLLVHKRDLILVAIGNFLVSFTFTGAISTFLPLYAKNAGIAQATIGTLFAVRALVSAAGRIPNSMVTKVIGDRPVLLGALVLQAVVLFGIPTTASVVWLTILLALDGLAFGAYLVAGQTYVADHTEIDHRGAAVGLYSAAGSVGGILAPLMLGLIAERGGVAIIFPVNGSLMVVGCIIFLVGMLALARTEARDRVAGDLTS